VQGAEVAEVVLRDAESFFRRERRAVAGDHGLRWVFAEQLDQAGERQPIRGRRGREGKLDWRQVVTHDE